MEKKTMGSFIAILRKAKGMTQKDLAELLNVSDKAVSRWEREESMPDIVLIPILADIFGVTCDELLRGERNSEEGFSEPEEKKNTRMKILLKRSLGRFRAFSLLAIAVAVLGLTAAVVCNFIFKKATLGFCVALGCFICGLIVQAVVCLTFKSDADTEEISDENIAAYRKSLRDGSLYVLYIIIVFAAICLPLLLFGEIDYATYIQKLSEQMNQSAYPGELTGVYDGYQAIPMSSMGSIQVGLEAKTWLVYGGVFMAAAVLGCYVLNLFVKRYDKKRYPCDENKKENVLAEYVFGLICVLVLTVTAAILCQQYMPQLITKSKTFETFEEFEEFIEGASEGMTKHEVAIRMMADPIEVYSESGEFLFKYTKINADVDRIIYGPNNRLPIKTFVQSDLDAAKQTVQNLMWIWGVVAAAECVAAVKLYKKKKR